MSTTAATLVNEAAVDRSDKPTDRSGPAGQSDRRTAGDPYETPWKSSWPQMLGWRASTARRLPGAVDVDTLTDVVRDMRAEPAGA